MVVLLAVATGLADRPARATDLAGLAGRVFDEESRPLSGVRMTLVGDGFGTQVTVTNAGGTYRFPGLRPLLTYRVAAPGTEWVQRGALFSYSAPLAEIGEDAAWVAGQLLSQKRQPSDFDLRLPTRHLLAVNETTALALGITFPSDLRVDVAFGAGPLARP